MATDDNDGSHSDDTTSSEEEEPPIMELIYSRTCRDKVKLIVIPLFYFMFFAIAGVFAFYSIEALLESYNHRVRTASYITVDEYPPFGIAIFPQVSERNSERDKWRGTVCSGVPYITAEPLKRVLEGHLVLPLYILSPPLLIKETFFSNKMYPYLVVLLCVRVVTGFCDI